MATNVQRASLRNSADAAEAPVRPSSPNALKTQAIADNLLQKPGVVKPPRSLIAADAPLFSVMDTSIAARKAASVASQWMESYDANNDLSQPSLGLTQGIYTVANIAQTAQGIKQYVFAQKTGDEEGKRLAAVSLGTTIPLVGAGTTSIVEKSLSIYSIVQAQEAINLESVSAVADSASVLDSVTMGLIALQRAFLAVFAGYGLYQKWQAKKEIEALPTVDIRDSKMGETPIVGLEYANDWIESKLDISEQIAKYKKEDFVKVALSEGKKWLSKLEKEWKQMGLAPLTGNKNDILTNLFMHYDQMALYTGIEGLTGHELMVAFGRKIMGDRLRAGKEQALSRNIGQALINKYKNAEKITKQEVIQEIDKGMSRNRWQIGLALLTVSICVAAPILTGGVGALAVSIAFIVSALLWMYGLDGARLVNQWSGALTGKFDKAMLIFSSLLNILAIAGAITGMIVLGSGVPLVPLLLLISVGLFWAVVNARGVYTLWRHNNRPWEYGQVVTLDSFHKLVQKEKDVEKINLYFQKMREADRLLFEDRKDWKSATVEVLNRLEDAKKAQLKTLREAIQ